MGMIVLLSLIVVLLFIRHLWKTIKDAPPPDDNDDDDNDDDNDSTLLLLGC